VNESVDGKKTYICLALAVAWVIACAFARRQGVEVGEETFVAVLALLSGAAAASMRHAVSKGEI